MIGLAVLLTSPGFVAGGVRPGPPIPRPFGPPARAPLDAAPIPLPLNRVLPGATGPPGPVLRDAALAQFRPLAVLSPSEVGRPLPRAGAAVAPAPAHPLRPGPRLNATVGWFVGFVNDSTDRAGILNVSVVPVSDAFCDPRICTPGLTASDGSFNISCEASGGLGSDYTLVLDAPDWWMNNQSYAVCAAGVPTSVGTLFLLRSGSAIGRVVDVANGRPISGVNVGAISRNGAVAALPTNVTNATGDFWIAVPPEPSKVTFGPPSAFLSTFEDVNATPGSGRRPAYPPWSDPIDLGTIALTPETQVVADLVDAVTGQPVTATASLQACDGATGDCQIPGAEVTGPHPAAFARAGPDYFLVDAIGYTQSFTATRTVPAEPPGTNFSLGTVWMTPLAAVVLESNLSEPTGGTFPWSAPPVANDSIYVIACSLDGYQFPSNQPALNFTTNSCLLAACIPAGVPTTVFLPPLRVQLTVGPDTINYCRPPPAPPEWQSPPYPSAFPDVLTLNLSAGHQLPGRLYANLTLGDFVAGRVYAAGTTSAPGGCFTVTYFSTDNDYLASSGGYDDWNSCLDNHSADWAPCASLGSAGPASFCAPVPPGDSRLEVLASGFAPNSTWVHVASYCCRVAGSDPGYPAALAAATADRVSSINLTATAGNVTGWAVTAGPTAAPPPIAFGVVVCAADDPTVPCGTGMGSSGTFAVTGAPAGLDTVELQGPGYASDGDWVDVVAGANVSAGTIPMSPDGTVNGTVVDPTGAGLYGATIDFCPVVQAPVCYAGGGEPLGIGLSASNGVFNGTVPGGWLPGATYVFAASASGYVTDWTFANVSVDASVSLPPLVLAPIVGNLSRSLSPRPSASASGVWITGRLLDNRTQAPPDLAQNGFLGVCPLPSGTCLTFPDGINALGDFNASVSPGLYDFNVSSPGYQPFSVFVNATGGAAIDLGTLTLLPDDWLSGRVAIAPWTSITLSHGGTFGHGYGPAALVDGCNATGSDCQLTLPVAQNGTFNVSVPPGTRATVFVSQNFGFLGNSTSSDLTGAYTELTGSQSPLDLTIFGVVAGLVEDGGSGNATGTPGPLFGLQYATGEAIESGNHTADVTAETSLDGIWIAFLPPGNGPHHLAVRATDQPGYDGSAQKIAASVQAGSALTADPTMTLYHYGWVVARIVTAGSGLPVAGASINVTGADPGLGSNISLLATSDASGLVNASAPPGTGGTLTVSAVGFNSTPFALPPVASEATTFLNGSGYATLGTLAASAFGTIRSAELVFAAHGPPLGSGPTPTVVDAANGLGVPGATVTVYSPDVALPSGAPSTTNDAGEFDADAPIGPADRVAVAAPGYETIVGVRSVAAGSVATIAQIALTGDAVLAGTAVSAINGTPVALASVTLCPPSGAGPCESYESNASGVFWGAAAPGTTAVFVNATGYVTNETSAVSCPDCWVGLGEIRLVPDGGVEGAVRGLPNGLRLPGANLTLCPAAVYDGAPCGYVATTDGEGGFLLLAPPGLYDLTAADAGFNATTLLVAIATGQITDVGTLFLNAFGAATGIVLDGTDGSALPNASVSACAEWTGGGCATPALSDGAGRYAFEGAPGPYFVVYTAVSFQSLSRTVVLTAGAATTLPTVRLYPEGDNTPVDLTGRVVAASDLSEGISGATVAAGIGGSVEFSTSSDASGDFTLATALGSYTVTASKPGDAPASIAIDADGPISGLLFVLGSMRYAVLGNVTDGLTGRPIAGVEIVGPVASGGSLTGPVLARTSANGTFSLALSNGSFALAALAPSGTGPRYPAVAFTVLVAGRPVDPVVVLTPPRHALAVAVDDADSGLGLAGAMVTIVGSPEPGHLVSVRATTSDGGGASATLYAGVYLVTVSASGYASATRSVDLTNVSANLTVRLDLIGPRGSTAPPGVGLLLTVAIAVGGAAVLAVVLLARRRRSPRAHASYDEVAPSFEPFAGEADAPFVGPEPDLGPVFPGRSDPPDPDPDPEREDPGPDG